MEPGDFLIKTEEEFCEEPVTPTVISVDVSKGNCGQVKEEPNVNAMFIHELKSEPNEMIESLASNSVPWIKSEQDYFELNRNKKCIELDEEALRRKFKCELKPVVRIKRLSLDLLKSALAVESDWPLKQICSSVIPEKDAVATAASGSSRFRSSEGSAWRESSDFEQGVKLDLDEIEMRTVNDGEPARQFQECGIASASVPHEASSVAHKGNNGMEYSYSLDDAEVGDACNTLNCPPLEISTAVSSQECQSTGKFCASSIDKENGIQVTYYSGQQTSHLNTFCASPPNECARNYKDKKHVIYKSKLSVKSNCSEQEKIHTSEKPFECSLCDKKYSQRHYLTRHINTHTGEKSFDCAVCGKVFLYKDVLNSHINTHAGKKPFECDICGGKFTLKKSLARHMKAHVCGKPHQCNICGRKFSLKEYLVHHMKIHTGKKQHECSICGKNFLLREYLTRHVTLHTGEKPFECAVCGKKFSFKKNLIQHITSHTGEKPFECTVCGKKLSFKKNLIQHITIHTGEKPFSCSTCQKKFSVKKYLTRHMKIHKS